MAYYVYFIIDSLNRIYIGYTVNLKRRIRQHCGELVGGAKYTKRSTDWSYLMILTCSSWTANRAMQIEWLCKYPQRKRKVLSCFKGPEGRINSLSEICSRVNNELIEIYIRSDKIDTIKLLNLSDNIKIDLLENLCI